MTSLDITVAGAGIGGLSAAAALARHGHSVTVAERAPEIGEVGAGIQISPNGLAVMRALGLEPALRQVSLRAEAVKLIDGPTGREVATLDLARHAADLTWMLVHRADLIGVLRRGAEAAGATLELGRDIEPPEDASAIAAEDLLVGADGIRSGVRTVVNGDASARFTGQVAWRAVIADRDATPVVEVHMGPARHLVSYPLPGGRRNIVAVEERTGWAEEGWNIADDPAHVQRAFNEFSDRARGWLDDIETVYLWGLFRHPVADRWWRGGQVLLGDAAHPTLPFLAQGANLALEDAWVLAAALAGRSPEQGLAVYQSRRAARARQVVAGAEKNARNYHLSSPPVRFAAHSALRAISRFSPAMLVRRFDWLYRYDVTKR